MLYIVAYDIASPKRLRRVAKVCQDYGFRMQKSVFECDMSKAMRNEMMENLKVEIDDTADSIASIPLCAACNVGRIELGVPLAQAFPAVIVA